MSNAEVTARNNIYIKLRKQFGPIWVEPGQSASGDQGRPVGSRAVRSPRFFLKTAGQTGIVRPFHTPPRPAWWRRAESAVMPAYSSATNGRPGARNHDNWYSLSTGT